VRIVSRSPEATKAAGGRLARLLGPGATVCLYGDLGAGKTTFIKGMARAMGIEEREITSASFTIISEHEARTPLYHIDLYRVDRSSDLDAIGFYDYVGSDGVTVIEWAEKADVEECVRVKIGLVSEDTREIIIEGVDEKGWDNMQKRKARAQGDT
jgi:tRNA threonylcarbamoyladenosine biosynthesis protein TsaE